MIRPISHERLLAITQAINPFGEEPVGFILITFNKAGDTLIASDANYAALHTVTEKLRQERPWGNPKDPMMVVTQPSKFITE